MPSVTFSNKHMGCCSNAQASETETIEAMNNLMEWLPENLPTEKPLCLVHGDFSLTNVIIDNESDQVASKQNLSEQQDVPQDEYPEGAWDVHNVIGERILNNATTD